MQIPNEFKKAWFGLATVLGIVVIAFLIVVGVKMVGRGDATAPATITITGKGEVKATPDVSRFMVTVEETAKDQSTALAQSSTKVNAIIDGLKKIGIDEKDIKTEYTNVSPKYEYQKAEATIMIYPPVPTPSNPVVVGYTSSHTLSVKVRDLSKVASVQKLLTDGKAQNISGPDLSIDDPDQLKLDAREKAIDDATEKAKILADQLDVRLGKIVSFSENSDGMYPMYMSARADAAPVKAGSPEANIATGEQTITSTVSITYRIK